MGKEKKKTRALGGGRRASGAAGNYKAKNYLFAIAINDYEHIDKLNNCVRDAEAVIQLLTEDFEFEREEVCFICSGPLKPAFEDVAVLQKRDDGIITPAKATRSVVLRELRRVAKLIEKDQQEDPELKVNLLLYYSGHGWYDDFLDQGYWIPVDSELDDYSKYISNGTIQDFLNGIPTHHTLLLSDSCFSGSLFATGTGKSLASTRLEKDASRWGITAGRNEVVSDGEAGKQSPFIESFLTELRAADTIAVQDLSTKILERVASNDKQTPRGEPLRVRGHKGGQFVFRKKANARKHFDAGQLIMRLARHQPEYARFRAAASQFEMAARLSKKPEDQITFLLWEARALGYAGLYTAAIDSLDKGISRFRDHQGSTPLQALKQALTWLREPSLLRRNLAADTFPTDENWASHLTPIYRTKHKKIKDCHLIQVAINKYKFPNIPQLSGCVDDAKLVGKNLMDTFGRKRFNTERLYDEDATKANIIHVLASLRKKVRKEDWVFIHISGHIYSSPSESKQTGTENHPFIIAYDTDPSEQEQSTIGHRKLHEIFEAIPCEHKVIIMDTDPNDAFHELAKTGSYTLLLATDKGQRAHETVVENNKTHGTFSYALSRVLVEKHSSTAAQKPLLISKIVTEKVKNQTPIFIRAEDFFTTVNSLSINVEVLMIHLLQTFFGARNAKASMITDELIHTIAQLDLSFSAEQWQRLAEQLPVAVNDAAKIDYYEKSLSLYQTKDQATHRSDLLHVELQLAHLYLSNGHLIKAKEYLTAAYGHLSDKDKASRAFITQKLGDLKRLAKRKKYALLVGRAKYNAPYTLQKELDSWKKTLLGLGYTEDNIIVLKDEKATDTEILSQFKWLAKKAKSNPTFFLFKGEKTLPFSELAALSQETKHLTVVLDTKFNKNTLSTLQEELDNSTSMKPMLGNTLLLPGVYEEESGQAVYQYHETEETQRGALSTLLTMRLQQGNTKTFKELSAPDLAPFVLLAGDWLSEENQPSQARKLKSIDKTGNDSR